MKSYHQFANIYDFLMREAPYEKWEAILKQLLENNIDDIKLNNYPNFRYKVADIGCGTGNLCFYLASLGHEVIGVDLSEEMLTVAEQKRNESSMPIKRKINFLCQDMRFLKLPTTVDIVVSFCDSLNYLQTSSDLNNTFRNVYNQLKDDGFFIFDILSIEKMRNEIGNEKHFEVSDETICIWQNFWNEQEQLLHYDVSFLVQQNDDLYKRFDEYHIQKGYTIEKVRAILSNNNFIIIKEFADFTFDSNIESAKDRYFWIVRKKPLLLDN